MESDDVAIAVTTLGIGAPVLDPNRFSQSILVEAAGHQLLFDTGRGAVLRLVQAGVQPAVVSQLFFTHYHSDHTVGFADFWLSSWLPAGGGRRDMSPGRFPQRSTSSSRNQLRGPSETSLRGTLPPLGAISATTPNAASVLNIAGLHNNDNDNDNGVGIVGRSDDDTRSL